MARLAPSPRWFGFTAPPTEVFPWLMSVVLIEWTPAETSRVSPNSLQIREATRPGIARLRALPESSAP
jgi:hypothetical protein